MCLCCVCVTSISDPSVAFAVKKTYSNALIKLLAICHVQHVDHYLLANVNSCLICWGVTTNKLIQVGHVPSGYVVYLQFIAIS